MKKPKDRRKDQTYFLYSIGGEALDSVLFPLGAFTKDEVRGIAERAGLPVAHKPESQDICFVGRGEMEAFFVSRTREILPGPIVMKRDGRVLGTHRGIVYYTVGQRAGLGISHPTPLYVIDIDPRGNRLVVGGKDELRSHGLIAERVKRLCPEWPERARAKIRYRKREIACRIEARGGSLKVYFDEEQEAVTPGQSVVLYEGDTVLGGGVIEGAI